MDYRVMMVEKDRLMLQKLSGVIERTPGFTMAVRYQNTSDALGQGKMFNPNLILLDIDHENTIPLIESFHESYPHADILCMAEEWQPESASHLVAAGACGCLIKPFNGVELQDAVKEFAQAGLEKECETLVFFSPKGKSGKTTLIANLAAALARRTHEQVGIIDADLQFGDMAVFFNLTPQSTIVEATRDIRFLSPVTLKRYFVPASERVHVLCGTTRPNYIDKVSIPALENLIRMSKSLFRYLLIDVPPGFNPTSISAAEASTTTYLCAMINGAYEIDHMRKALEIFKDWPDVEERAKVIFTRVSPCTEDMRRQLETKLGYPVTAIIPNEYLVVSHAADNGQMATEIQPDNPLAKSVDRLAEQIAGHRVPARWSS